MRTKCGRCGIDMIVDKPARKNNAYVCDECFKVVQQYLQGTKS